VLHQRLQLFFIWWIWEEYIPDALGSCSLQLRCLKLNIERLSRVQPFNQGSNLNFRTLLLPVLKTWFLSTTSGRPIQTGQISLISLQVPEHELIADDGRTGDYEYLGRYYGRRCIPRPISHFFVGTTNTTKDKWSGYLPYLTTERRKQGILSKKEKKKTKGLRSCNPDLWNDSWVGHKLNRAYLFIFIF